MSSSQSYVDCESGSVAAAEYHSVVTVSTTGSSSGNSHGGVGGSSSSSSYSSVHAEAAFSSQPATPAAAAAVAAAGDRERKDDRSERKWGGCLPVAAAAAYCMPCTSPAKKGFQGSRLQQGEKRKCSKRAMCIVLLLALVLAGVGAGVGTWASRNKAQQQMQQQQGYTTGRLADAVAASRDVDAAAPAGSSSSKDRLNFQVVVTLPASSAQKGCTMWFDSKEVSQKLQHCMHCCADLPMHLLVARL
jgi:hypothetical protein